MKRTRVFLAVIVSLVIWIMPSQGRTLHSITDTNARELKCCQIAGTTLVLEKNYSLERSSPVGLAIAGDYMFVSFENSGNIEVISAKTPSRVDLIVAPWASNLRY